VAIKINKHLLLKRIHQSTFDLTRFFVVFAVLSGCFYTYVGLTSPGGKTYSYFLDHYLNVPAWLTCLIAKISFLILKLIGFAVYQRTPNNVTISGSSGVTILWACLGFAVMSFWTAFVVAHKASRQFRIKWCIIGNVLITVLNITRIVLIALANYYHWKMITSLEPHTTFNIASYILLFALTGWFILYCEQHQQKLLSPYQQNKKTAIKAVYN
jgi:exosortase/archaeosortase family protein